jgi:hypothetical protein
MSLKSRPDGLDQKLILMPQQKQSFCALNTKITIFTTSLRRRHYLGTPEPSPEVEILSHG